MKMLQLTVDFTDHNPALRDNAEFLFKILFIPNCDTSSPGQSENLVNASRSITDYTSGWYAKNTRYKHARRSRTCWVVVDSALFALLTDLSPLY